MNMWGPFSFRPLQSENTLSTASAMEGLRCAVTSELAVPQGLAWTPSQLEFFPGVASRVIEVRWLAILTEDNG